MGNRQASTVHDEPASNEPKQVDFDKLKADIDALLEEEKKRDALSVFSNMDDPDREKRIAEIKKLQGQIEEMQSFQQDMEQLVFEQDEMIPHLSPDTTANNVNDGKSKKEIKKVDTMYDIESYSKDKKGFEQQLLRKQLLNPSEEIIKDELSKMETNLKTLQREEQKIKQQILYSHTGDANQNKLINKLQKIQKDIKDLQSLCTMAKDLDQMVKDINEPIEPLSLPVANIRNIDNSVCNVNGKIIKEGWTNKKSKHLGVMRKRWTVLFEDSTATFKLKTYANYKQYDEPTECIQIDANTGIASKDEKGFIVSIALLKQMFVFEAQSTKERDEWIKILRSKIHST